MYCCCFSEYSCRTFCTYCTCATIAHVLILHMYYYCTQLFCCWKYTPTLCSWFVCNASSRPKFSWTWIRISWAWAEDARVFNLRPPLQVNWVQVQIKTRTKYLLIIILQTVSLLFCYLFAKSIDFIVWVARCCSNFKIQWLMYMGRTCLSRQNWYQYQEHQHLVSNMAK